MYVQMQGYVQESRGHIPESKANSLINGESPSEYVSGCMSKVSISLGYDQGCMSNGLNAVMYVQMQML